MVSLKQISDLLPTEAGQHQQHQQDRKWAQLPQEKEMKDKNKTKTEAQVKLATADFDRWICKAVHWKVRMVARRGRGQLCDTVTVCVCAWL